MSNDDDHLLADYDLAAWEPPPPNPGLADAVIARARQPAPAVARDASEPASPSRRRWWIAGTVTAVAMVALVIGVWGVQRTPEDGQGIVIASGAQTLSIGPTTAQLDRGAEVRWRRDHRRITADQARGSVNWSIASEDTLVIDAGAMVASVEATGASLRVEVEMIASRDARVAGIGAATAVAVALVTVAVYEGQVRVRHDGQTVNIAPGGTYEVRPKTSPEQLSVGGGPADPRVAELRAQIKELEKERVELRAKIEALQPPCDEVSCVLSNYEGECCAAFKKPAPTQVVADRPSDTKPAPRPTCDAAALAEKGNEHLFTGMDAAALAAFEASYACKPDPGLVKKSFLAACRSKNAPKAKQYYPKLPADARDALLQMCVRNGIDPSRGAATAPTAASPSPWSSPRPPLKPKAVCQRGEPSPTDPRPACTGGLLEVMGAPQAKILIDGVDTKKLTPATFDLAPGRHKVTYAIDGNRYTFTVTIKADETVTLSKVLE